MARLDVMLWNVGKTESVRASKIRSLGIYGEQTYSSATGGYYNRFKLLGWFNANEFFYFGSWDTDEEALAYLEGLHRQIEGR